MAEARLGSGSATATVAGWRAVGWGGAREQEELFEQGVVRLWAPSSVAGTSTAGGC